MGPEDSTAAYARTDARAERKGPGTGAAYGHTHIRTYRTDTCNPIPKALPCPCFEGTVRTNTATAPESEGVMVMYLQYYRTASSYDIAVPCNLACRPLRFHEWPRRNTLASPRLVTMRGHLLSRSTESIAPPKP
jgi:hypothetical protein